MKPAAEEGGVILQDGFGTGSARQLVMIEVELEAAAREFMENDPCVGEGLLGASLHPFRAAVAHRQ